MAGQMALPVDCRTNGTSSPSATGPVVVEQGVPPPPAHAPLVSPLDVTSASPPGSRWWMRLRRWWRRGDRVQQLPVGGGPSWVIRHTTTAAVLVVAAVAAVASYQHMRELAELAGEGDRARLLPLSVDGLMVAASMSLLVRKRSGESVLLAWFALGLGGVVSVIANVAAAEPTVVGRVVAAWPPVALLLSYELLMQQIRRGSGAGVQPSAPTTQSSNQTRRNGDGERNTGPGLP